MNDPHISTEMHRMCASVVQVVHVFRATPPAQTLPTLKEFDTRQNSWTNRLLPDIPALPPSSMQQASLDREDGGLGLLPASVVAIPAFVGSKVDTSHAVFLLPGQPSITEMTACLPPMLASVYDEHDVMPTDDMLVPSLLQNPGHNQKTISRALQKRRAALYWPSEEVEPCSLSVEDQTKLSRMKSITTSEALAWQTILPGEHELPSSSWCLWLQVWLGAVVYEAPANGSALRCHQCHKTMDQLGIHSLGNCLSGYGRTARHNRVAVALRQTALIASGISSRREETGLFPDAEDRPGDIYITSEAGCTESTYKSAAIDATDL